MSKEHLGSIRTSKSAISGRRLRVRIGPTLGSLVVADVNNESNPHFIDSPYFTGHILVRVKDFAGVSAKGGPGHQADSYFGAKKRKFAIQIAGRFKQSYSSDDVLFGADFDKQIQLPIGTWIAMKFATLIDPAIQSDVYCEKPWILSPLLCAMNTVSCRLATTMQYGQHTPDVFARNRHLSNAKTAAPELNFKNVISDASDRVILDPSPAEYLGDWIWKNEVGLTEDNSLLNTNPKEPAFGNDSIEERRKYFQKKKHRLAYDFSPDTIYNFEIFAPFMDFNTFDLELGINVNIIRYLNNQPVRLVAKSLSKNIPFFYVEFLLVEENGEMVTPDTMTSQELERLDLTDNGLPEQVKSAEIELAKYQ